ncbi:hypothetical protein AV530_010413 [Patagioenas fasciata monilis]|uniref:Uncharacterized protein n=1 Tax=Patagioenas fasciata monilis TaxID=372326 RepID=A0A1V4KF00_PATFA|nr:hypothetical protein AV530_010413 [Patagioenas fasciata monilis]
MEPMELKIWMLVCWLIADTDMPELTCSPGSAVWDQGALPRTGCLARTEFVKNCIEPIAGTLPSPYLEVSEAKLHSVPEEALARKQRDSMEGSGASAVLGAQSLQTLQSFVPLQPHALEEQGQSYTSWLLLRGRRHIPIPAGPQALGFARGAAWEELRSQASCFLLLLSKELIKT